MRWAQLPGFGGEATELGEVVGRRGTVDGPGPRSNSAMSTLLSRVRPSAAYCASCATPLPATGWGA